MSSDSINSGPHNTKKYCSNFVQVAPANNSDSPYHAQKQDAEVEYLGRVRMTLHSCVGSITFASPVNIRQVHETVMNEVRNEATYISNKYKSQSDPIQFKWDKFLPTLEKRISQIY